MEKIVIPNKIEDSDFVDIDYKFNGLKNVKTMILLNDYGIFEEKWVSYVENIKLSKYGNISNILKNMQNLKKIMIDEDNANYILQDDILFSKDMKTLAFYSREKTNTTYIIPEQVEIIGDYAFQFCSNLEKIEMSNNIIGVNPGAFSDCSNLKEIKLSENLEEISNAMFAYCTKLKELNLPSSIKKIGGAAFCQCKELETIFIPNSVNDIDISGNINVLHPNIFSSTFGYCENLLVTVESGSSLQLSDFTNAGLDKSQVIFE